MRRHPELGRQWLQREKRLQGVSELVTHHERWDGAGLPRAWRARRSRWVGAFWRRLTCGMPYDRPALPAGANIRGSPPLPGRGSRHAV